MPEEFSELDIEISDSAHGGQQVALAFKSAEMAQGTRRELDPAPISIEFAGLLEDEHNDNLADYGTRLQNNVFAPPAARALFADAQASKPLRIRLRLRSEDPRVHALRWEVMTGHEGAALSTRAGLAFSRFHSSGRQVTLRPSTEQLRALVAVVNPTEEQAENFGLADIEVDFERRAKALGSIQCDPLTGEDGRGPVTMNRLMAALRQGEEAYGGYDILYLVCHGTTIRNRPHLLFALETPAELANRSLFTSGEQLAKRLVDELKELPRLVVLASCAGAGTGSADALSATGPLLAKIGIPAVMAMQGFIQINTVDALLPAFFAEFEKTGEVDRAMQAARRDVRNYQAAADWWAPVLFMRLEEGELTYKAPEPTTQAAAAVTDRPPVNEAPAAPAPTSPAAVTQNSHEPLPKPDPLNMANFNEVRLYKAMSGAFNTNDLGDLGYVMGIDLEEFGGRGLKAQVREFIMYCKRRSKIEDLLDTLAEERPERDWYADAGLRADS